MYGVIILGYIIIGMISGAFFHNILMDRAVNPIDYDEVKKCTIIGGIFWPLVFVAGFFVWLYRLISYVVDKIYYWNKEKTRK